jgi:hypothetical protein
VPAYWRKNPIVDCRLSSKGTGLRSCPLVCPTLVLALMVGVQATAIAAALSSEKLTTNVATAAVDRAPGLAALGSEQISQAAPAVINIMPSRYRGLSDALWGYQKTHVWLVGFNGTSFSPAGAPDDLGSFYLIPRIAVLFNVPLDRAIDGFYLSILAIGLVSGAVGLWLSLNTNLGRGAALLWVLVVALWACRAGDVYIVSAAVPLAAVPWLMWAMKKGAEGFLLPMLLLVEGLAAGIAHTIRSHSTTALLIFTVCLLLFYITIPAKRKVLLVMVLIAGFLVPQLCLRAIVAKRDAFLEAASPGRTEFANRHVLWHNVYIGFGFLANQYVPAYDDSLAIARVEKVASGVAFGSVEYERVLRTEVFELLRHHPVLVATTLAAKAGVMLCLFLAVVNVGLLAAVRYPKRWPVELGFWFAIAFSSLPGLLVMPASTGYTLGFVTFSSLYAITSTDFALSMVGGRDLEFLRHRVGSSGRFALSPPPQ